MAGRSRCGILAFAVGRLDWAEFGLELLQGGRHRVVAAANRLHRRIRRQNEGAVVALVHNDVVAGAIAG